MKKNTRTSKDVSLVIPVYNNSATVRDQLKKCIDEIQKTAKSFEILISNDMSTDNTKELLNEFKHVKNVKIFHQKKNLGIANNILFLYKHANNPFIVLFSLDGDWNVNDITRLILHADKSNADIVIGKRSTKNFQFKRRIISVIYNLIPLVLFGVKTYDTGSIKLLRKKIIEEIPLQLQSVSYEAEMLIKAVKKGYKVEYIPINFKKHKDNKKSSVNTKLILHSFIDLLRLRLSKI